MQHLVGALAYGSAAFGNGTMSARGGSTQATVLVSQPSMELTDRMYSDLIDSLRYSRDAAERHAVEAEKRAQLAESRLHELHSKIAGSNAISSENESHP